MLLLCSFFILKELFRVKNDLTTSLLFFFENAKNLGRSDDPKGRKKRGWPKLNFCVLFQSTSLSPHWFPRETTAEIPHWESVTTQIWVVLGIAWSKFPEFPTRHDQNTHQIWVVTRYQYGILVLVSQASFRRETSGGVAKCRLFSQAMNRWWCSCVTTLL